MFKVGLTGGIASGKSTISEHFKNLGVTVYDTDEISHDLMQPDQPAYLETVHYFGPTILNEDKTINRPLLRKKVFQNADDRRWLERMIHPMIRDYSARALQQETISDYILLVVPLMFETGFEELVDYVIAINCPVSVQKSRLMQRDGIDGTLADQMIASQMSNEQRIQLSDQSINNEEIGDLLHDIKSLHVQLKEIAHQFKQAEL